MDVKNLGSIILENSQNYPQLQEEYKDAALAGEAEKRLSDSVNYKTHDDVMKRFCLSTSDLDDVEVYLE